MLFRKQMNQLILRGVIKSIRKSYSNRAVKILKNFINTTIS